MSFPSSARCAARCSEDLAFSNRIIQPRRKIISSHLDGIGRLLKWVDFSDYMKTADNGDSADSPASQKPAISSQTTTSIRPLRPIPEHALVRIDSIDDSKLMGLPVHLKATNATRHSGRLIANGDQLVHRLIDGGLEVDSLLLAARHAEDFLPRVSAATCRRQMTIPMRTDFDSPNAAIAAAVPLIHLAC